MEKIKLEWIENDTESKRIELMGHKNICFSVYTGSKCCRMYKGGAYFKDFNFPQDTDCLGIVKDVEIKSKEEGRKFCQDWLDNFIDNENRKEREKKIRDVLEDIWSGKTELKWEDLRASSIMAKFSFNGKDFHFFSGTARSGSHIFESHDEDNKNIVDSDFGYNSSLKPKKEIQDWYNKFLLEQASQ